MARTGMNPLGPTFRAETQTDPTVPPWPEEEGGEATAEPEDPSAGALEKGVVWSPRTRRFASQTCENASSDRIFEVCRQPKRGRTGSRSDWGRGRT